MAQQELHSARFYAKRKAYVSCLNRTRWIIENYPGTPAIPDALALQVWAYGKLQMKDLAEQEAVRSGDERNYQRVLERLEPFKNKVALHERNIEAIQKELAKVR